MSTARTLGNIGDALAGTSSNTTTFSSNVAVTGTMTMSDSTQFNTANSLGMRNRIMNGAFTVWQRGTSSSLANGASSDGWASDRWVSEASNGGGNATGGTVTWSQASDSSGLYGGNSQYYMNINCTSFAGTGSAPNSQLTIFQRIEAANIYDLAGKTVTLSFYSAIASVSGGTFVGNVYLGYGATTDNFSSPTYIGPITFSPTATPQKFTITTTLTSGFQNGCVVYIRAVNTGTTATTVNFNVGSVQLEQGTVATTFERRPYGLELALCQRYYEVCGSIYFTGYNASSCGLGGTYSFKATKRVTPTLTTLTTPDYYNCSAFNVQAGTITTNGFGYASLVTTSGNTNFGANTPAVVSAAAEI